MERLIVLNNVAKCKFCGQRKNDLHKFGPLYRLGKVTAHYFCVLLSNRLIQNGSDEEGILGFLLSDILNELKRTSNIYCTYCKKKNATIKCAYKNCKRSFHLHCGLKRGSSHQFSDQFKSFCHVHGYFQNIPYKILEEAVKNNVICCICHEKVEVKDRYKTLWAPCCMKTWYHRFCLQELAHSAGYFFKCATCNNVQKFNRYMQRYGIFVPQQDASWERVPNAFSELLFRYGSCDAEICQCPYGRQKNDVDTEWEVIVCNTCGSQGIHVNCGNLKYPNMDWECQSCKKVTKNMKNSMSDCSDSTKEDPGSSVKLTELGHKKKRRGSEDLENFVLDKRKKSRISVEEGDEDIEIDVETVDEEPSKDAVKEVKEIIDVEDKVAKDTEANIHDVLTLLKPGPLSYKLSVIRKTGQDNMISFKNQTDGPKRWSTAEVIDITQEEEPPDDDIKMIEENSKHCPSVKVELVKKGTEQNDITDSGTEDKNGSELEIAGRNRNEEGELIPSKTAFEFIDPSVCILSSMENEEEVTVLDCKHNKLDIKREEKMLLILPLIKNEEEVTVVDGELKKFDIGTETFDDDVIILTD